MIERIIKLFSGEVFLVGDGAGWVIDNICQTMANILRKKRLKITVWTNSLFWLRFSRGRMFYFVNRMAYLHPKNARIIPKIAANNKLVAVWWHSDYGENNEKLIEYLETLKKLESFFSFIQVSCGIEREKLMEAGIRENKIVLIPEGIEEIFRPCSAEEKNAKRKKTGIPENAFCVGSFQKDGKGWDEGLEPKLEKGPDIFVKVIEKLWADNKNLFVVLTGPARGYVKKELKRIGAPFIHKFLKDYKELPDYYHLLDLYLVTSRTEGGPKAVLESLACGVPLISTKVGMAPDVIENGENGFLAEIEDADKLAEKVEILINDRELRQKFAENGLKIAEKYSWDKIAVKFYNEIYEKLK